MITRYGRDMRTGQICFGNRLPNEFIGSCRALEISRLDAAHDLVKAASSDNAAIETVTMSDSKPCVSDTRLESAPKRYARWSASKFAAAAVLEVRG